MATELSSHQNQRSRRHTDRRMGFDRRVATPAVQAPPSWREQRVQFVTRYLFWILGLVYFNLNPAMLVVPSIAVVNGVYVVYGLANTGFMLHARHYSGSPMRWRLAMLTDILFVSFCFAADHSTPVPPALMAYLAVILGNGMRYSIGLFREAVIATFATALFASYLRFADNLEHANLATAFVMLFGGIVVLYAYRLMKRIEKVRSDLEREGRIDPLTGLLNRRGLYEKAEVLFSMLDRSERPIAVVFADLDKFKAINDRHGHREGDRVLREVGQLLMGAVRSSDILARYGGDEFVLVLPDSDLAQAGSLAERLQVRVEQWANACNTDVGVSIGVAEAPRHGHDLETVLAAVDRAMYRGKGVPHRIEYAEAPSALLEEG